MDSFTFFNERVQHFDVERKIIDRYKALITPSKTEIHTLSWETSQQQENAETAAIEVDKITSEIELAEKELAVKREELADLRESQAARLSQISRLSQLAQPIETDVTYIFNEKPMKKNSTVTLTGLAAYNGASSSKEKCNNTYIESCSPENIIPPAHKPKQLRTGDILRLENRVHEVTKMAYEKFALFDSCFLDASSLSQVCQQSVYDKISTVISAAKNKISEMGAIDSQSFFSVNELLMLRLKIMIAQRMEVEELEALAKERAYFEEKESELKDQILVEISAMKKRLKFELAGSTFELKRQLEAIRVKRERLEVDRVMEQLMEKEHKRPGSILLNKKVHNHAATGAANSTNNIQHGHHEKQLEQKKEMEKMARKNREKEELEARLVHLKTRYMRLRQHFKLEMQGYQTEMGLMRNELDLIMGKQKKQHRHTQQKHQFQKN